MSRGPLPDRLSRARVHLDGFSDYRRGVVQRVLAEGRIELDDDAELVLGRGQAVVEALAEGRAAYVYGDDGGDGWVTPERYEALEAEGSPAGSSRRPRPSSGYATTSRAMTRPSARPAASWPRPTTRALTPSSSSRPSTRSGLAATPSTRR